MGKTQSWELNKKVFALLLLNRIVAENLFVSDAGNSRVESLARSRASKMLSEQMNQLAGNLIKEVDLNFDLRYSDDYTTGWKSYIFGDIYIFPNFSLAQTFADTSKSNAVFSGGSNSIRSFRERST